MSRNQHSREPYKKTEISILLKVLKKIKYTGGDLVDIFTNIDGVILFDSNGYDEFPTFELEINKHGIIIVNSHQKTTRNYSSYTEQSKKLRPNYILFLVRSWYEINGMVFLMVAMVGKMVDKMVEKFVFVVVLR